MIEGIERVLLWLIVVAACLACGIGGAVLIFNLFSGIIQICP
jgi:hypothetical protein